MFHTWVGGLPVQFSARLMPPSQVNEQSDGMFPPSIRPVPVLFEIVIGVVVPVITTVKDLVVPNSPLSSSGIARFAVVWPPAR